jgi:hypothetical protein
MKRSLICLFILEIFIYWGSTENAFSQADAGDDKFFIKGDPAGTIIGGANDNPLWCYSWEPKTGLSDPRSPCPTATPDNTTTYKLKVVGTDFSFTSEDEMTVYVLDKLKLKVENDITECMEKREVTFTATIMGDLPLPLELTDEIEYIFHYKTAYGTDLTENELSSKTIQDNTLEADTVPPGDADHKYKTSVYAEAKYKNGTLTSDTIKIDVYELWIEYVRYYNDNTRLWKVVVGEAFEYSAIASSDCKNWNWKMEDGVPDQWHPSPVVGEEWKKGTLMIPFNDLSGAENSDFGDAYGTITVSCEDEEGNEYSFSSTDLNPSQKVKVFFDPDKNIEGNDPSTDKPPCWFIFWKDGKVVEGMDMDNCVYRNNIVYGAWNAEEQLLKLGPLACDKGDGPETLLDRSGNVFSMTGSGKHLSCVAETIRHELYHKAVSDSMANVMPQSDSDELPDPEEISPNRSIFKSSDPDTSNTFHYNSDTYRSYADQEVRCRIIEISPGVKKTFPDLDWSKDIENPKW